MEVLQACEWPGNVRQLERVIERGVTLASGPILDVGDLPAAVTGDSANTAIEAAACNDTMRAWGSRYARIVLDRCRGNKRKACRMLGISYHTLEGHLKWSGERRLRERAAEDGHAARH
jgi:DNA-binding NtrC family response regulator